MKVLFASSEAHPLMKTGGLADVSGALPLALRQTGDDVRLLLPGYPAVLSAVGQRATAVAHLHLPPLPPARLLAATLPSGLPLLVVDCPVLYERPGGPYQQADGTDWPDNDLRFGLLSRVAACLAEAGSPLDWRPDVLHCNDWQTGLAPAWLSLATGWRAPTVFTIHNLAYQGAFLPGTLERVGLPWSLWRFDGVEHHGQVSYLKAGLQFAGRITTVSPTYAEEIRRPDLGFGLDGLLAWRGADLAGILNGIDTAQWDPARDPHIPVPYDASRLAGKAASRDALRQSLGLDPDPALAVAGVVSRLTHQKGLDLLLAGADELLGRLPLQLAALGSGEAALERGFTELARRHPGRVGVRLGFDEAFSHLVEAGADLFLMPSRFEPCGLNQMYSQRYGTPVVARATGGLADSITDLDPMRPEPDRATGFLFREASPAALAGAVERALEAWADRPLWARLQRNGMARDFSWEAAARRYRELYDRLS